LSTNWPGLSNVTGLARKLMSSAPLRSTCGWLCWLADSPRPPVPGASGTTGVWLNTVSDGLAVGMVSV
jgi:hypothetical protein